MMTVGWFNWITLDSEHEAELATDAKQRENWIKLAKLNRASKSTIVRGALLIN